MSTATSLALTAWSKLQQHLDQWFYRPDTEALEIAISAMASHYVIEFDPIWLFLIGPSSSGKTSIVINALKMFPESHLMGTITSKTLMSGYRDGDNALLHKIGKSGILLFKDFTTLLSLRDDEQREINGQLREVYDGEFVANKGTTTAEKALWKGKISCLGVCTSAFERAWAFRREMGERFIQVRWPRVESIKMARYSASQRGHEGVIHTTTQQLGKAILDGWNKRPAQPLDEPISNRLAYLSEFVAKSRGHVIRDTHGQRDIIDCPPAEQNPRLHKSLELLLDTNAQLFNCQPRFEIAYRVAWDTIPPVRSAILRNIPLDAPIHRTEIVRITRIPDSTIRYHASELLALGIIQQTDNISGAELSFTEEIRDLVSGFDKGPQGLS